MFGTEAKLNLFIDWIFLDVATRPPKGKNPTVPIRGVYIEYEDPPRTKRGKGGIRKGPVSMRSSDISMRRYVAIQALMRSKRSLKQACQEVGARLEKTTRSEMMSISTGYSKCRHPLRHSWLSFCVTRFENWLAWEIKENLVDSSIPFEVLAGVMKMHASKMLGDSEKGAAFTAKWRVLACRAVVLLGQR